MGWKELSQKCLQESSGTGRALCWSLYCVCTIGSSLREIFRWMLPRSQPDMFRMQGYCWCSESYQRHSQKWRSGLEGEAKGESKWDLDHAVSSIDAWKAHYFILRTFQQDQARQDTLDWLDDQTIVVINDWAMKLFPICFRERQSQWFAKCGSSWHLSAVVHKSNHPDCPVVFTSEHLIPICDSYKQD